MTGIFVSYRRDDALGVAGRLCDHLKRHFARDQIFFDMDAMRPGIDFVKQIEIELAHCDVLLAVIGSRWLNAADGKGLRRLDNENDFVRIEIASALQRDIPVIPILIDGALMPSERDLPDDLKALARRHALEIRSSRFAADTESIVQVLKKVLGRSTNRWMLPSVIAATLLVSIVSGLVGWNYFRTVPDRPVVPASPAREDIVQAPEGPADVSRGTDEVPRSAEARRCQQELDGAAAHAPIIFSPAGDAFAPESLRTLEMVARIAAKCEGVMIEVQGHTDSAQTAAYNVSLTLRRAQAVVRYMVEAGVPATRLRAAGYADRRPIVPNDSPENRRKNRRIQFAVMDA